MRVDGKYAGELYRALRGAVEALDSVEDEAFEFTDEQAHARSDARALLVKIEASSPSEESPHG